VVKRASPAAPLADRPSAIAHEPARGAPAVTNGPGSRKMNRFAQEARFDRPRSRTH